MKISPRQAASNPFSTRFVRPGALAFRFSAGTSAGDLIERLAANGWTGEIVGPHGSGKSTLLAALLEPLRQTGRQPVMFALHDGQRRLPENLARRRHLSSEALIVVDGFEQLGWLARFGLRRLCRRRGWGLLTTAHATVGLPLLYRTETSLELAESLANELFAHQPPLSAKSLAIDEREVARSFAKHDGNLRDTFFALYDWCEQHRPEQNSAAE